MAGFGSTILLRESQNARLSEHQKPFQNILMARVIEPIGNVSPNAKYRDDSRPYRKREFRATRCRPTGDTSALPAEGHELLHLGFDAQGTVGVVSGMLAFKPWHLDLDEALA